MARVLGYGGLGNTNGARSFAGKAESDTARANYHIGIGLRIAVSSWLMALTLRFLR